MTNKDEKQRIELDPPQAWAVKRAIEYYAAHVYGAGVETKNDRYFQVHDLLESVLNDFPDWFAVSPFDRRA